MKAIVVEGLTKRFEDLVAVDHISFEVERGEIFAFLGPNGAGKTTTINMLITILKPSEGDAYVFGYSIKKQPQKVREKIGVVFQDPTLDTYLTAYENLYIHGKIYGYDGENLKSRIEEVLEFVDLKDFKNKVVSQYSGGMARRLEIARAFLHSPEILFLDEPTIGLDPQTRLHIWEYIKKIKGEKGTTVFLTTHYLEEAEALADKIAIIDHGKIIAMGTLQELRKLVGPEIIFARFDKPFPCEKAVFPIYCKKLADGKIEFGVNNAEEAIPKIFEIAHKENIKVLEIIFHKPTLNDIFIHLTGKSIRETEGDFRQERTRRYMRG